MPTDLWSQFDAAPLALTLRVAIVATVLALLLGIALGWVFARTRLPGRNLLEAICMLPLVLPPTVLGYGILLLMGRRSALGGWLREHFDYTVIFHWHGAVIASAHSPRSTAIWRRPRARCASRVGAASCA
jgi:molybdate transport system permease protein